MPNRLVADVLWREDVAAVPAPRSDERLALTWWPTRLRQLGGSFHVAATAAPGHTLAELDRAITEDWVGCREGPTDAIRRAHTRSGQLLSPPDHRGFSGKVRSVNAYNVTWYQGASHATWRGIGRGTSLAGTSTTEWLSSPVAWPQRRAARPNRPGAGRLLSGRGVMSLDRSKVPSRDRVATSRCLSRSAPPLAMASGCPHTPPRRSGGVHAAPGTSRVGERSARCRLAALTRLAGRGNAAGAGARVPRGAADMGDCSTSRRERRHPHHPRHPGVASRRALELLADWPQTTLRRAEFTRVRDLH